MTRIETRQQYEWALGRIEALVDIVTEEMPEDDPAKMEYCILSSLVADYSDEHFDLGTPSLQEVLKERMFEQGLSQKDVAAMIGTSQSRVSDMISGKCHPTYEIARNLCCKLGISPAVVLGV